MPVNVDDIEVDDYGIVFSGGGALGAWEVGCIAPILKAHGGRWPSVVTGASAGALNAAGLCAGLTDKDLGDEWAGLRNEDVYVQGVNARAAAAQLAGARGWRAARDHLLSWVGGVSTDGTTVEDSAMHILRGHRGFYDTTPFKGSLTRILEGRENVFLSSPLRLAISTTQLADGDVELFYKMPYNQVFPPDAATGKYANAWREIRGMTELIQALTGTTALPLLFPPMEGRFDGGVLMNQPISPALRLGARRLYVLIPSPETFLPTENLADIGRSLLTNWLSISLEAQIRQVKLITWMDRQMRLGSNPTPEELQQLIQLIVIRPPTPLDDDPDVGLLKFGSGVDKMLVSGKVAAEDRLSRFDPADPVTWDNYLRHPQDAF